MTGYHDRFRRVVNDQINPSRRLDGANIPPFATDDTALHFVGWQMDYRHRAFGDKISRESLDRDRDDFLCSAFRLFARFRFDLPDVPRTIVAGFVEHLVQQGALGLVPGQSRRFLEFLAHLIHQLRRFGRSFVDLLALLAERVFSFRDLRFALGRRGDLLIQRLLFLGDPLLDGLRVLPLLSGLTLPLRPRLQERRLRLGLRFPTNALAVLTGFVDQTLRRRPLGGQTFRRLLAPSTPIECPGDQYDRQGSECCHELCHARFSL